MAKKKTSKKPMRRKAKATQAEKVEVRTPAIGDNNPSLAIPEPEDWDHHKKTILGWREKVTTAQSHLRNAIKQAKKSGVNMESLNLVVGIERQNDPAKTMQFFKQIDLGLSLGESTLRLTAHDTLAGDEEELVAKRGYEDGKAGRTPNNKYPEGSDLAKLYSSNWQRGQAEILGVSQAAE